MSNDLVHVFQYSICLWILNPGWLMLYTIWLAELFEVQFELTSIVLYVTTPWISTQPDLFITFAMQSKLLSKILLAVSGSLPLTVCLCNWVTMGSSTISNQLEVASIMARAMKSICELSLPLRVYEKKKSTHKHFQGLLMMVLGGRYLYLCFRLLFVWQVLQDIIIDRMVVRIPFQYIAELIVSLRRVCPGCCT